MRRRDWGLTQTAESHYEYWYAKRCCRMAGCEKMRRFSRRDARDAALGSRTAVPFKPQTRASFRPAPRLHLSTRPPQGPAYFGGGQTVALRHATMAGGVAKYSASAAKAASES